MSAHVPFGWRRSARRPVCPGCRTRAVVIAGPGAYDQPGFRTKGLWQFYCRCFPNPLYEFDKFQEYGTYAQALAAYRAMVVTARYAAII